MNGPMLPVHNAAMNNARPNGFLMLGATVTLLAISMVIVLTMLRVAGIGWQRELTGRRLQQARAMADACAEHALVNVRYDMLYAGDESLSLGVHSCDVHPLIATASAPFDIDTQGQSGEALVKIHLSASVSVNASGSVTDISINSWDFVDDF